MKIFVINPGSTSTKIALFIDEKPVWAAGAHHTADDLSEFHHVNEQYAYRKDFVLPRRIFRWILMPSLPVAVC